MRISTREVASLVEKARTLFEIIEEGNPERKCASPNSGIRDTVLRWRDIVASGDQILFEKRLRAEGFTLAEVYAALGREIRFSDADNKSRWAGIFIEIVLCQTCGFEGEFKRDQCRFLHPDHRIPFEEILVPLVKAGSRSLETAVKTDFVTVEAVADLER